MAGAVDFLTNGNSSSFPPYYSKELTSHGIRCKYNARYFPRILIQNMGMGPTGLLEKY